MKPCRICKTKFEPARPLQRVCSPVCALEHAKAKMAAEAKKAQAADRQETKAKLDAMRTKPQLVKLAQQAFNSYIRARQYREQARRILKAGAQTVNAGA